MRTSARTRRKQSAPVGIFTNVEPSKHKIIEALAKDRVIERLTENITGKPLDALSSDLVQTVYCYLLEFDEEKIRDLWRNGELSYFAVRIIWNQWYGSRSTFRAQLRGFALRSVPLDGKDWPEKQ